MSSDNPPHKETDWSTVVSRSARARVPRPIRKYEKPGHQISQNVEIVFEDPEITDYLRTQRALSIVQTALQPGSVLFTFPAAIFNKHTEAYKLVVDQLGPVIGNSFIPISVRGFSPKGSSDLIFSTVFCNTSHATQAISQGIVVDGVTYKATPYKDRTVANDYLRVYLNLNRQEDNVDSLVDKLKSSMSLYGKVLQIKRLLRDGFFEGEVSIVLNRRSTNEVDYKPLQRMLFLEEWDVLVPARYTGADKVCYFCRKSGHIKQDCPVLKEITCRRCGIQGHTQRRCNTVLVEDGDEDVPTKGTTFEDDYDAYMQLSQKAVEMQQVDTQDQDEKVNAENEDIMEVDRSMDGNDKEDRGNNAREKYAKQIPAHKSSSYKSKYATVSKEPYSLRKTAKNSTAQTLPSTTDNGEKVHMNGLDEFTDDDMEFSLEADSHGVTIQDENVHSSIHARQGHE